MKQLLNQCGVCRTVLATSERTKERSVSRTRSSVLVYQECVGIRSVGVRVHITSGVTTMWV